MAEIISSNQLELMRNELREEITFCRKQQREFKLNQNRKTLEESAEKELLSEEFVAAAAKNLKRKSLNIQEYRKLQNALIQSENHINTFLKVDHAIHGLIRDLSSLSTQSKLSAANCCCNLSLGNSKACNKLCKFAAPYLIAELESTNQPLTEVCAWTIGNIAHASDNAFYILHAQGCLKSLINIAEKSSDVILPAASYALLRYIYAGSDSIETKDLTKLGEIISQKFSAVADINTVWLIALLSSIPDCTYSLLKCTPAICDYLIKALFNIDESIEKISAALRIICNIISEPSGEVAYYLFKDGNEKNKLFLEKLLSHQYIHIRQETLWLLGNLLNHTLDLVQKLVKQIIFELPSLKLALNSYNELNKK